ncbi:hypothetical protein NicSoilC5_02420 [Arthrobacter sp. NicSoilC5]|nr:hypothetical protein NicSoilC5_02420 [Arthrobacter sp. NicSoilC5]
MVLFESFLKWAKGSAIRQVFDGPYAASVSLGGKGQAGPHGGPIHEDRARTADPMLTPELDAGEFLVIPQVVGQSIARVYCNSAPTSVYFHVYFDAF